MAQFNLTIKDATCLAYRRPEYEDTKNGYVLLIDLCDKSNAVVDSVLYTDDLIQEIDRSCDEKLFWFTKDDVKIERID
jgi:hypothetical protein